MNHKLNLWCVIALFISSPSRAAVQYLLTDMGTDNGKWSKATDINDNGQIVGEITTWSNGRNMFFWQNDTGMQNLGMLGGKSINVFGINDHGQTIGQCFDGYSDHSFIWQKDTGVQMIPEIAGSISSDAKDINNQGQVVGDFTISTNHFNYGYLWQKDTGMQSLGTLPGDKYSAAYAINDNRQIVGWSMTSLLSNMRAVIWEQDSIREISADLGSGSSAYDINNNGQIVGRFMPGGATHAFLWQSNVGVQDLGTITGYNRSEALCINDSGQIVGNVSYNNTNPHAFIWDKLTGMIDLNSLIPADSGLALQQATAINNFGQIVGYGINSEGYEHAFLLTPVPEPSTLALLLTVALGGLLWWRRRS